MNEEENHIIREFARGDNSLREVAILIHRKHLDDLSSPEQCFMSEIDNPCPDLMLRNFYRGQLLK